MHTGLYIMYLTPTPFLCPRSVAYSVWTVRHSVLPSGLSCPGCNFVAFQVSRTKFGIHIHFGMMVCPDPHFGYYAPWVREIWGAWTQGLKSVSGLYLSHVSTSAHQI